MTLPRLPSIRELIKLYGLSAKSQLSQNFILDKNVTDKIVRTAHVSEQTPLVMEVGPGPGLLSRSILDTGVKTIIAIEKDDRFIPTLQQLSEASAHRFKVIQGNVLDVEHQTILDACPQFTSEEPLHIMGNLPFNIATPLLLQWLHLQASQKGLFGLKNDVWMTLMFQKEVGDRIIADVSTSKRGRLSVMAQSLCNVKEVYKVPSTVFVPKPKVDASVIQLITKPITQTMTGGTYITLENILRYYFTKRRKTMGHITKRLAKELPQVNPLMEEIEIMVDFKARPEDVTTEQFYNLAKFFHKHNITKF
ncbi:S-adenosyl-L-methionine-dependent methyltransferase [Cokeromyces recurvatus]|uniref:S-adenosyl-L-methionine-dependent methyltransferase n=1 Tax=Cokeromyces recurvatus TaxID=90255 RepID=UPI00221F0C1E|nr:S-adenosyl-L-methionine-dependent methyltransferase [Cokeromyces recurvatus]KAI7900738.1 S-adenosyl-L-methionine-dependent methyltransferase [Cokeromyces recurvatus]